MKEYIKNTKAYYLSVMEDLGKLPCCFNLHWKHFFWKKFSGFSAEFFDLLHHELHEEGGRRSDLFQLRMKDSLLDVTLRTAFYEREGAIEWQFSIQNNTGEDSGILNDVFPLELSLDGEKPVLKGILGDHRYHYQPYEYDLEKTPMSFECSNGRTTHKYFPYFNLEHGDGGTFIALGWGGTWQADFRYFKGKTTILAQGNNGVTTYLKPSEALHSALVVLLPYGVRDEDYATNLWRRWFIDYNTPKQNVRGDALQPFLAALLCDDTGKPNSDGSISEDYITSQKSLDAIAKNGLAPEYRWLDAGWYCDAYKKSIPTNWRAVGAWEVDEEKWPNDTLRQTVRYARKQGMKTLAWFEPERVENVDGLVENFEYNADWAISNFNDIGNPSCLEWTYNRIVKMLNKNEIDLYREDNNFNDLYGNPAEKWRKKDILEGGVRQGITENNAVYAHYLLWERLCARNGETTFVDNCASGGGRLDIWSMRYSVPINRSDADRTSVPLRLSITAALSKWIPFNGADTSERKSELDPSGTHSKYAFRASYLPIMKLQTRFSSLSKEYWQILREGETEWRSINRYLLKDFYTLTPWHDGATDDTVDAFEYFDPQTQSGILQVFRQVRAKENQIVLRLKGLDPDAEYVLQDADDGREEIKTGRELEEYLIDLPKQRTALLKRIRLKEK